MNGETPPEPNLDQHPIAKRAVWITKFLHHLAGLHTHLIKGADHLVSGVVDEEHRETLEVGYDGKDENDQRSTRNAAVGPT